MKIICIGRNYSDHTKEMNAPLPSEPLYFMKPDTAIFKDKVYYIPDFTNDLHHEIELVVKISKMGKHIDFKNAGNYYEEIGLGIDFTARDIQQICKEKGLPWEKAKAFDNSALLAKEFFKKSDLNLENTVFGLRKNDKIVQEGNSKDMIFSIDEIICHLSKFVTLKPGDLIYTGTPQGVSAVQSGDKLEGYIENKTLFSVEMK